MAILLPNGKRTIVLLYAELSAVQECIQGTLIPYLQGSLISCCSLISSIVLDSMVNGIVLMEICRMEKGIE